MWKYRYDMTHRCCRLAPPCFRRVAAETPAPEVVRQLSRRLRLARYSVVSFTLSYVKLRNCSHYFCFAARRSGTRVLTVPARFAFPHACRAPWVSCFGLAQNSLYLRIACRACRMGWGYGLGWLVRVSGAGVRFRPGRLSQVKSMLHRCTPEGDYNAPLGRSGLHSLSLRIGKVRHKVLDGSRR